jgi:hypothetical protein
MKGDPTYVYPPLKTQDAMKEVRLMPILSLFKKNMRYNKGIRHMPILSLSKKNMRFNEGGPAYAYPPSLSNIMRCGDRDLAYARSS